MYSLNIPVSAIRTKIRQEFEKHRYVQQLGVVDVLLFQSHAEYQVSPETTNSLNSSQADDMMQMIYSLWLDPMSRNGLPRTLLMLFL